MPLVVEGSIAFSVLVAFIVFGVFFFRIRERFDTLDSAEPGELPRRSAGGSPVSLIHILLLIPLLSAVLLLALPWHRLSSLLNAAASFATFLAAIWLLVDARPEPTDLCLHRRSQYFAGRADQSRGFHDRLVLGQLHRS